MTFDPRYWQRLSNKLLLGDWEASYGQFLSYKDNPNQALSSWIGTDLALMQRKVSHALDQLSHDNHLHRIGAIYVLRDYWPKTELTASAVATLLLSDQNSIVRGTVYHSLLGFCGWLPDPDGVLDDLLSNGSEITRVMIQSRKDRAAYARRKREEWVEKIGPLAREMLGDVGLAENALQERDPQFRHVALEVMALEMTPNHQVASLASQMIQSRLETDALRKIAASVLSKYWRITRDPTFNRVLTSLVKDESCSNELRFFAYLGLFDIRGSGRWPSFNQTSTNLLKRSDLMERFGSGQFRFPEDVGWSVR